MPDRTLITGLFVNALRRAGYDALPEVPGSFASGSHSRVSAVLEGRIWTFQFRTLATTVLDVDLSLALHDPQMSAVLWHTDFPPQDALPFWIGLGCKPDAIVSTALNEVEAAALMEFAADPFSRGACEAKCLVKRSPWLDSSHAVVMSSSWTGTDQGEITGTAHGSDVPEPAGDNPREARREAAPGKVLQVS